MKLRSFSGRCLLAMVAVLPWRVSAYTLTPSVLTLRPGGGESSAFLQLANKEMKTTAVEITVNEHRKNLDGQAVAGPATDQDFLIYPAQLVLLPGDEVGVQVRWIGDPLLPAERAFTLAARQVPLPRPAAAEPESGPGVRIDVTVLLNYEVRVYVTPPGARPKLVVESVTERPPSTGPGAPESAQLEIIIANQGTAHQSLETLSLVLVPLDANGVPLKSPAVTLTARMLAGTKPHLLAGDRRRLLIPRPAGLPAGPIRVLLSE